MTLGAIGGSGVGEAAGVGVNAGVGVGVGWGPVRLQASEATASSARAVHNFE